MRSVVRNAVILIISMLLALTLAACSAPENSDPEEQGVKAPYEHEQEAGQKQESEEEQPEQEPAAEEEEEEEMDWDEILDSITINTQSSIRIEGSKTIYVDPYLRSEKTHDADLILITHAHYDHFNEPSLRNAANENTHIICPYSMENDLKRLGIGRGMTAMQEGATAADLEGLDGITVEAVPAYNMNKSYHPKKNGWLGYIITMDGVRYYAAGDTDALPELEDVDCDIAFVPVGGTFTMTAEEASGLVDKIAPKYAVPIHYGTIVGRAADAETFKNGLGSDIKAVFKVEDAK